MGLPRVLVLTGPTGVGKTRLSLELARRLHGEIISGDPFQAYRGLDIGTDKVMGAERASVPHHLLDILDPHESFNVQQFKERCEAAIRGVLRRNRVPIVVSGSGFYVSWLTQSSKQTGPTDLAVRKRIRDELTALPWEQALERLREVDPARAAHIQPNDLYRLSRALEIAELTGQKPSDFAPSSGVGPRAAPFDYRMVFLVRPRLQMLRAIDLRCELMVQRGLMMEVLHLMRRGFTKDSPSARAIGYRESIDYLTEARLVAPSDIERHAQLLRTTLHAIMAASRQFARRQVTWARRDEQLLWLARDAPGIIGAVEAFLDAPRPAGDAGGALTAAELFLGRSEAFGSRREGDRALAEDMRAGMSKDDSGELKRYRPRHVLLSEGDLAEHAHQVALALHS